MGCLLDDLRAFSINAHQWTTAACQDVNLSYSTELCMEIGSWKYNGKIILLLVQTTSKSWGRVVCWGHGRIKPNNLVQGRSCIVLLLSLTVILRLSRSLHVSATQDSDKSEIQPEGEPESLHSCVLSCVKVGQA